MKAAWATSAAREANPLVNQDEPGCGSRTVLVVDGSSDSQVNAVPPVLLCGCECLTASNEEEALSHLESSRPLMTLVDAHVFDTMPGENPMKRVVSHPSHAEAPMVLLAETNTPTELVEAAARAGVSDCLLRPVGLPHIQERIAALSGHQHPPERRPARVVLMVEADDSFSDEERRLLTLSGYRLLLAHDETEAIRRVTSWPGMVDAVVMRGDAGLKDAEALSRLRRAASVLRQSRCMLVVPRGSVQPEGVDSSVHVLESEQVTPHEVLELLEHDLHRGVHDLRAQEAVPFYCPVLFRELGREERWHSCFSHDVSPGGLFLSTLAPARVGAALELRIFLTTTGEELEGTGVVAWSNPWFPGGAFSAPVGMGIQFLGMSPKRLARLRELCSTSIF